MKKLRQKTKLVEVLASQLLAGGSFGILSSGGKKYIVPAWIEVPAETVHKDVKVIYDNKPQVIPNLTKHTVKGSKGDLYTVVIDTVNGNSCSCVGYTYHRTCKHIKSVINI